MGKRHEFFKCLNGMWICKLCGVAKTQRSIKKKCPKNKLSQKIIDFIDRH